ncbi:hypothetical protein ACFVXE_24810 [Streptomyces sp. NPDC058231]|uniref:hypothetical protein n=1 Tax=Streptomyces sp. NPDC058231 TaxID=3346392 RepID=UPI0036E26074
MTRHLLLRPTTLRGTLSTPVLDLSASTLSLSPAAGPITGLSGKRFDVTGNSPLTEPGQLRACSIADSHSGVSRQNWHCTRTVAQYTG